MVRIPTSSAPSCLLPEIVEAFARMGKPGGRDQIVAARVERAVYLMRSMYDGRYPRCKECRRNEHLRRLGRLPAQE